ncbi:MAG TPA: nuclear transport factor 2 family protein [Solirubrobacterales bacterium]|jgi:predicted SnoaL-like aldol condensation-catalyzing enzyme|nr:nuclear transport factor 2 family protein [Solirubrobacterales bacterium]
MPSNADRAKIAHSLYRAFAAGEREAVERLLAPGFTFHSPPDPELDRDGYFERCWPGAGNRNQFEFVRTIESGNDVVVTYEATRPDGSRFRNTEVLTFDGERVAEVEVYFGWDL